MQFTPGDVVGGYVLAEDNQWYPQPPPGRATQHVRQVGTSPGGYPQDAVTPPSEAPSQRSASARPRSPGPAYTLWWWWAAVVVVLVLVGVVLGTMYLQTYVYPSARSNSELLVPTQPATAMPWQTPDPVAAGGLGAAVRDGEVEFTVTGVDCARSELGQEAKIEAAHGQFCVLSVQATNKGNTRVSLPTAHQARTQNGFWLAADYVAQAYLSGSSLYTTPLEPSATASGPLVFDLPSGQHLTVVRLHGAPDSSGVVVKLS